MKSLISLSLIAIIIFGSTKYNGSTLPAVMLAGGVIKAKYLNIDHKYKRKDCPVCKGKGWYISGDGIKKVECGYCEPDNSQVQTAPNHKDDECKTIIIRR